MALLTPPPAAPQRGDRTTFASRVDAFITWLINFVSELLALVGSLNSIATGGAYSIPYVLASQADLPSSSGGKLAPSSGAPSFSAITTIYIDGVDLRGTSIKSQFDDIFFTGNSNVIKGDIRIVKQGDPSHWASFKVTAWSFNASNGPWGVGTLTVQCTGYSSVNPFDLGDALMLLFQRTGDKGDPGVASFPSMHIREEQAAGTAAASGTTISSGVYRRVLNTVKTNDISGASLSGDQVTLTAVGKYRMRARAYLVNTVGAPGTARKKTAIYDVTGSAYASISPIAAAMSSGSGNVSAPTPIGEAIAIVTISGTRTFEVRSLTDQTISSWGSVYNVSSPEAYTEFLIEKIG